MLNLFLFPVGARGDFLASILVGDQLLSDGLESMITNTGCDCTQIAKIHKFGQSNWADVVVDETTLGHYQGLRIDVSDPNDCWNVAWLNWYKKPPVGPSGLESMIKSYQLLHSWNQKYKQYDQYVDYVIPFNQLFDVDYITELYQKINSKPLALDAVERIKYNIELNNNIVSQNPFVRPA
jgi:hypothetical protein